MFNLCLLINIYCSVGMVYVEHIKKIIKTLLTKCNFNNYSHNKFQIQRKLFFLQTVLVYNFGVKTPLELPCRYALSIIIICVVRTTPRTAAREALSREKERVIGALATWRERAAPAS